MNNARHAKPEKDLDGKPVRGPSLGLVYGLILLAILAAIVVAAFIVLPFYNHR